MQKILKRYALQVKKDDRFLSTNNGKTLYSNMDWKALDKGKYQPILFYSVDEANRAARRYIKAHEGGPKMSEVRIVECSFTLEKSLGAVKEADYILRRQGSYEPPKPTPELPDVIDQLIYKPTKYLNRGYIVHDVLLKRIAEYNKRTGHDIPNYATSVILKGLGYNDHLRPHKGKKAVKVWTRDQFKHERTDPNYLQRKG